MATTQPDSAAGDPLGYSINLPVPTRAPAPPKASMSITSTFLATLAILVLSSVALAAADAVPAAQTQTTTDWCVITTPARVPSVGDFNVAVSFKATAVPTATMLFADLHWWKGATRVGPLMHANPVAVQAGKDQTITLPFTLKAQEGLSAIAVVIFVSPDGTWANHTAVTEIGIPLSGN